MLFLWYPPKEAPGVVWDVIRGSIYDQDWASGLSYTNKLLQKHHVPILNICGDIYVTVVTIRVIIFIVTYIQ